jgi:hypothetical protein
LLLASGEDTMLRKLGILCVLFSACATTRPSPPPPAAEAAPQRHQDTPEEKIAAMRGVDPNLHTDEEQRRWLIEQNKQRKKEAKPKATPAGKRVDVVQPPQQTLPPPNAPSAP